MKICIGRLFAMTLTSILVLFGFSVQARAQNNTFNKKSRPLELQGRDWEARETKSPDAASGYEVLYSFGSTPSDGARPLAAPIRDVAGNLYGTTVGGGNADSNCQYLGQSVGCGTVFGLDPTGRETLRYNFCPESKCLDGANPNAGLIQDAAGNLYGTTYYGGGNDSGTVFELDKTGHETVLYSFCSAPKCADGSLPLDGLIRDAAGNLYGTTQYGGVNGLFEGTVFKLAPSAQEGEAWTETVLYSFCSAPNCPDGTGPEGGLIQDSAGNMYGTTYQGGSNGSGTVFKIDNTGHETVIYSFCSSPNCTDGSLPVSGLTQDSEGNLYGTTSQGGANEGGTVFKVDTLGHQILLYSFCSVANCADGSYPASGLIQDAAGNLYGTTQFGGVFSSCDTPLQGCGTVFKLDEAGHETVLYSFCAAANCADGQFPWGGLIQDVSGNLYGTTARGGTSNSGTVFKFGTSTGGGGIPSVTLSSSLNPSFVNQSVTFSVVVSGSGVTPTGSVTFKQGTTPLGTVTLAEGLASFTTTFTKSANASVVASYSGDENYKAKNSKPLKQVVELYPTSTALTSGLNPSFYGQAITLTATESSEGPTPTGNVTFKNGSASLGCAPLVGGIATITKSTLSVGTWSITASYGGDTVSAKSTSGVLSQVVKKATSTTAVVSSLNPSMIGKTVKFTATVASPSTKPTGTVTFRDGTTVLGTRTLAEGSGKASYSTSALSSGSHKITAVYGGTANIGGSTSSVLKQTVN